MVISYLVGTLSTTFHWAVGQIQWPFRYFFSQEEEFQQGLEGVGRDEIPQQTQPVLISNAIRGNTQKWMFKGDGYKDPVVFLENIGPAVARLINSVNSAGKKVNAVMTCKLVKTDPATGKDTFTIAHFRSKVHTIYDNVNEGYVEMKERILENFYNGMVVGGDYIPSAGWIFTLQNSILS